MPPFMRNRVKKLFKVKRKHVIANVSLNLYSFRLLTIHLCFIMTEHCMFLYDALNVKKDICSAVSKQKIRNQ